MNKNDLKDLNGALQRFNAGTLFPSVGGGIVPLAITGRRVMTAGDVYDQLSNDYYSESLGNVSYSSIEDEFEITGMDISMNHDGIDGKCRLLFATHASGVSWPGDHPRHDNGEAIIPLLVDNTLRHLSLKLFDISKGRWAYTLLHECHAFYETQVVIYSQENSRRIPRATISLQIPLYNILVSGAGQAHYYAKAYYNDGLDVAYSLSDIYREWPSPFTDANKAISFYQDASSELIDLGSLGRISIQYSTAVGMIVSVSKLDGTAHPLLTIPANDVATLFSKGFTFSVAKYQSHYFPTLEHADGVSPNIELVTGLEIFASDANGFIEKVELLSPEYTDLLTVEGDSEPAVCVLVDDQRTITIPEGGEYGIYSVVSEGDELIHHDLVKEGFAIFENSVILTDGDGNIHSVI